MTDRRPPGAPPPSTEGYHYPGEPAPAPMRQQRRAASSARRLVAGARGSRLRRHRSAGARGGRRHLRLDGAAHRPHPPRDHYSGENRYGTRPHDRAGVVYLLSHARRQRGRRGAVAAAGHGWRAVPDGQEHRRGRAPIAAAEPGDHRRPAGASRADVRAACRRARPQKLGHGGSCAAGAPGAGRQRRHRPRLFHWPRAAADAQRPVGPVRAVLGGYPHRQRHDPLFRRPLGRRHARCRDQRRGWPGGHRAALHRQGQLRVGRGADRFRRRADLTVGAAHRAAGQARAQPQGCALRAELRRLGDARRYARRRRRGRGQRGLAQSARRLARHPPAARARLPRGGAQGLPQCHRKHAALVRRAALPRRRERHRNPQRYDDGRQALRRRRHEGLGAQISPTTWEARGTRSRSPRAAPRRSRKPRPRSRRSRSTICCRTVLVPHLARR